MELLSICLDQRWLLQLRILVQIPEADPIVEGNGKSKEEDCKRPEVELEDAVERGALRA